MKTATFNIIGRDINGNSLFPSSQTAEITNRPDLKKFGRFFIAQISPHGSLQSKLDEQKRQEAVRLCPRRFTPECSKPPGIADKHDLASISHNANRTKITEKSGVAKIRQGLPSAFLPSWVI